MSFSSVGERRVVLQQYKFRSHQIVCIIKVLPDTVSFFDKQPANDFSWMTAGRWARLENGLWKLFAGFSDFQEDVRQLKTQIMIDHIQVSVSAAEELLPAAQKLLQDGKASSQNEIVLEIILKYMSYEDTINPISPKPTKRKHDDKVKKLQLDKISDKIKSKSINSKKMPKSGNSEPESSTGAKKKSASAKSDAEKIPLRKDDEQSNRKHSGTTMISKKRERRSISQDSQLAKDSSNREQLSRNRSVKRSKSPSSCRPARSLVRPGRYDEFDMGDKPVRKAKSKNTESNSDSSSDKPNANGIESISLKTLKNLNDMLDTPKPREVNILLLKDMNEADVLDTFESYRVDFDRLFKERERKFQTTSYKGITHCDVMDILSTQIRNSMIQKLSDLYSKAGPHGTLVINGLLPLWIIRLFMDRYKFTQDEAVRQIIDQLEYHTYLKAVNNEPLSLDLKD
ncbi:uncharacterized protein CG4951 [Drosophila grimshawi]|uniref:uncharacterized protein CG4951 n=1 Tax=Drosophila grimshawi TaxID=7222 RepID=UPI000C86E702|nr:uncharacterized protein CG4951 [Drosophila grimshawi]